MSGSRRNPVQWSLPFICDKRYNDTVSTAPLKAAESHSLYLEERKLLIDAARESARGFDQAVLAFGAAAFGASVAFLKDVVPKPTRESLIWLEASWLCFSIGVLAILLSFLFSHRACLCAIDRAYDSTNGSVDAAKPNRWSAATNICNWSSVAFFFVGILFWTYFVISNLNHIEIATVADPLKKGYVPPAPPKQPPQQPSQPPTEQPQKEK